MPVLSVGRRVPARPVRPSFHDPRFTLPPVGQSATSGSLMFLDVAALACGAARSLVAVVGLRPGALVPAAVAVAAGATCLLG
jgi:hypothetical protein